MNEEINLVMITDEKYILPTIVAIRSIVKHIHSRCNYRLYLIADEDTQNIWTSNYDEEYPDNFKVIFVHYGDLLDNLQFEHLYVSKTALLKFWIPEILKDVNKVLYLDGDILVRDDLKDLYDIDISNYYAAAVKDMATYDDNHLQLIGLTEYFNSGVMLLNLALLRDKQVSEQLLEAKKQQKIQRFMDQDAFNLVFRDHVKYISPVYNYIPNCLRNHTEEEFSLFYQISVNVMNSIRILHLAGEVKPWDTVRARCFQEWFSYLKDNKEVAFCLNNYLQTDYDVLWGHTDDLAQALDKNIQRIDNQRAADADEMRVDIRYLKDHTAALAKENQHIDAHYKAQIERIDNQLAQQQIQDLSLQLQNVKKELAEQNQRIYDMEMLFWNRVGRKIKNIFRKRRS